MSGATEQSVPNPSPDIFRLDGQVAVVTGASSGLGARFARVLDAAGANLVLVARREERLRDLSRELSHAAVVTADLGDPSVARSVVDAVEERFGRLDVLVNNAGTSSVVPAQEESLESFERVLRLNLTSAFALAQAARQLMDAGSIINVASMSGIVGNGQMPQASYSASKGGLISLTRELAAQGSRSGPRVNALCPGFFPSEMTTQMMDDERSLRWLRGHMTGQQIVVDGGWTTV